MKIPDFTELRPEIDPRLDLLLQQAFQRERGKRYQSAGQMLTALEQFLYGDGYGPTNEKLALYMADLFGPDGANASNRWSSRQTPGLHDD